MPKAFSLTYGLDLDTEVASFWEWLQDVRNVVNGSGEADKQLREFVEGQRDRIDRFVADEADPAMARLMITLTLAGVGFHYASQQKLLNGLDARGLLQQYERQPAFFDTIAGTPFEGPEPPR